MLANKNREDIRIFVCAVSLYVAETPKASVKDHETPLPVIPLDIVIVIVIVIFLGHFCPRGKGA